MTMFNKALNQKVKKSFLTALTLTSLLVPAYAFSAERDSTALFFSLEDLKKELSKPDFSQLYPNFSNFSWKSSQEQADREGPIERNYRWGNGLGFDSYNTPGVRRPLWGY
ncbi:MAG: hypothetical protein HY268_32785 [Deltaproteobacteria bacterium]|nr:hypothetical protein [Deltaproteobacteria bacterium]